MSPRTDSRKEAKNITKMSISKLGIEKQTFGKICIIMGKANGLKSGEDASGKVWTALTGVFEGRVTAGENAGDVFRSGKLFLPSGIHEAVEAAVKSLPGFAENKTIGAVKFAMEITRVKDSNPIGYSYQAVNIIPMDAQEDDLSDLVALAEARISAKQPEAKQIEAPVEIKKKK
jgi:hypothetical protein